MYEVNGIVYASKKVDGLEVVSFRPMDDPGVLLVTFTSGETRLFDVHEVKGSAFNVLKEDDNLFKDAKILHGVVTWDNGNIDLSPEAMYEYSFEYQSPCES